MRKRILTAAAAATLASAPSGWFLSMSNRLSVKVALLALAGTDGASAAYFNPAGIVGVEQGNLVCITSNRTLRCLTTVKL